MRNKQGGQDEDLESLRLPKSWAKTVHHAVLSEHPSVTSRTAKTNPWYAFASRVHCLQSAAAVGRLKWPSNFR